MLEPAYPVAGRCRWSTTIGRIGCVRTAAGRQGGVKCGAFGRLQRSAEGGLGEGGQQTHAPMGELGLPGLFGKASRAGAFVEGVQASGSPDAELDDLAADSAGDDAPFAFGVAGYVTRRPKAMNRVARALARVDLPRPIWPARNTLGLVSTPRR